HDVSMLIGLDGWAVGVEPGSKIWMTIMRPPQHGHGSKDVGGSSARSPALPGSSCDGETPSRSRARARLSASAFQTVSGPAQCCRPGPRRGGRIVVWSCIALGHVPDKQELAPFLPGGMGVVINRLPRLLGHLEPNRLTRLLLPDRRPIEG